MLRKPDQTTTMSIQSTTLYCKEHHSDKVYMASIEPKDDLFIVTFAYGPAAER